MVKIVVKERSAGKTEMLLRWFIETKRSGRDDVYPVILTHSEHEKHRIVDLLSDILDRNDGRWWINRHVVTPHDLPLRGFPSQTVVVIDNLDIVLPILVGREILVSTGTDIVITNKDVAPLEPVEEHW